ncbi:hypothetical protein [Belliella aquatica]|nr:hypothetical protein [Belliella aquatica]MCH7407013.1 hypothetical protein [Belliella aquatica]
MRRVIGLIVVLLTFNGCGFLQEFEEVDGPCIVFLFETDDSGMQASYVIDQDLRRNKKTGVFTYRILEANGSSKLWSISRASEPEEDGTYKYFSKSQDGTSKEVDRIECGNQVYLKKDESDGD